MLSDFEEPMRERNFKKLLSHWLAALILPQQPISSLCIGHLITACPMRVRNVRALLSHWLVLKACTPIGLLGSPNPPVFKYRSALPG